MSLLGSYCSEPFPQVHIPIDSVSKGSKGLAFVTYARPQDALAAFEALNKKPFQGRLLHIMGAIDRKSTTVTTAKKGHDTIQSAPARRRRSGCDSSGGANQLKIDCGVNAA